MRFVSNNDYVGGTCQSNIHVNVRTRGFPAEQSSTPPPPACLLLVHLGARCSPHVHTGVPRDYKEPGFIRPGHLLPLLHGAVHMLTWHFQQWAGVTGCAACSDTLHSASTFSAICVAVAHTCINETNPPPPSNYPVAI